MSVCRSCGAQIKFIQSAKSGKWLPCDIEQVDLYDLDQGDCIVNVCGEIIKADGKLELGKESLGYVPHWATCPNAEQFRKR